MTDHAYDGTPMQAGLESSALKLTGDFSSFSLIGLHEMIVTRRLAVDDPGNRSKTQVEYECRDVQFGEIFFGVRRLSDMGGMTDGDDDVLHPSTKVISNGAKATAHTRVMDSDGDVVLVGFIDGSRTRGVIVGVLRHHAASYGARSADGERRFSTHKGTSVEVKSTGEVEIKQQSGTAVRLLTNGDVEINAAGNVIMAGASPAIEGVVVGTGIDPFTGATYNVLGSASSRVFAKK